MEKVKRSYYLPIKLVKAFDADCEKNGYVREKVVAASLDDFMRASPDERARMFDKLDAFLNAKRGGGD